MPKDEFLAPLFGEAFFCAFFWKYTANYRAKQKIS